jgi:energy-coupling factor transporter ATP-binding protein EcfA2
MNGAQVLRVLALHSSAVVTPGGALLFLGHAGAGKSTIVRLLAERFPTLADDAVFLLRQAYGTWHVADGTVQAFAGPEEEDEASTLECIPLRAVLRIYQDTAPALERIGQVETCRHLTDAAFEIAWQKSGDGPTARRLFSTLAEVARRYPAWQLRFDKENGRSSALVFRVFGDSTVRHAIK